MPLSCNYSQWLVETAQQIGFGTAESPTSYADIYSWQKFSGVELSPFEAETIRELCIAYISGSSKYRESCDPPFMTGDYKMRMARAAAQSFMSA